MLYADTSFIVRGYLVDEPESGAIGQVLFGSDSSPVMTSEMARVEFASAVQRASRAGRIISGSDYLARFAEDCGSRGLITLLPFRRETLASAERIAIRHGLRPLDALHLAVALEDGVEIGGDKLTFATRDREQAAAAQSEGLQVA